MEEMKLGAKEREACYSLLAGLLLNEPTPGTLIDSLDALTALLRALGQQSSPVGVGLSTEALAKECAQEYYDAFFVPKSGRYVPPYASCLLAYDPAKKKTPFGLLDPKAAARVRDWYDRAGFKPHALSIFAPLRQVDPADNIAFELAFMANLCHQQAQETEGGAAAFMALERDFLSRELLPCLPNFTLALSRANAPLYAQVAQAALLWAQCDAEALGAQHQ